MGKTIAGAIHFLVAELGTQYAFILLLVIVGGVICIILFAIFFKLSISVGNFFSVSPSGKSGNNSP